MVAEFFGEKLVRINMGVKINRFFFFFLMILGCVGGWGDEGPRSGLMVYVISIMLQYS